jgi:hypothetical protein
MSRGLTVNWYVLEFFCLYFHKEPCDVPTHKTQVYQLINLLHYNRSKYKLIRKRDLLFFCEHL